MTDVNRRKFLGTSTLAVAGTAAGVSGLAAPAIAKDKMELRMVTSWPANFPGLGTAANNFAERVNRASGGRISVKVYAGGELVGALKVHDAVQEGTADMYHSSEFYFQGKSKALSFFSSVPFGLTTIEINSWIYHGGGQELWDEVSAPFNVKPLACGNVGPQMGGWYKEPITSVEDFQGLKMRIPGIGGDVLKALGGIPVTLPGAEILPALQAGTIDATEWVGPWNDLAFGIYKVTKNYHYPGFHDPGSIVTVGVNKEKWDAMSDEDRAIIEYSAMAENLYNVSEYTAKNATALETLINEHDVNLIEFPQEVYDKALEIMPDILSTIASIDAPTKKVTEAYIDFRAKVKKWSDIGDGAYYAKRKV